MFSGLELANPSDSGLVFVDTFEHEDSPYCIGLYPVVKNNFQKNGTYFRYVPFFHMTRICDVIHLARSSKAVKSTLSSILSEKSLITTGIAAAGYRQRFRASK